MNASFSIQVLFAAAVFLLPAETIQAQDTLNEPELVRWVSQFPAGKTEGPKRNIIHRLFELVVGKKEKKELSKPVSVMAYNTSSLFILDQGNETILKVNDQTSEVPRCIRKKENSFSSLVGICSLPGNRVLFTDSRLEKVFLFSENKNEFRVLNDSLALQQPTGIAYSKLTREIWVVETGEHRVSVLSEEGKLIRTIGNRGKGPGEFNYPTFICMDDSGDAYIVDALNFRIQIFNRKGEFLSAFGEQGDATGFFARPKGIAVDSYGNIYVADALFHTVQIFDRKGNFLYQFGEQGRDKGKFWMPCGLYIDENNYIYIADMYNSRVQVFQLINNAGYEEKVIH